MGFSFGQKKEKAKPKALATSADGNEKFPCLRTALSPIVSYKLKRHYRKQMKIRKVSIQDIENLKEIAKRTFVETYSSVNSEENMTEYLENKFSIEELKTELNDKNSEFYFSEFDEKIIGYLKINTGQSQTEIKDKNALEIERIYVQKEFYGKRVGQNLYEKAIKLAKEKNAEYVWLSVWEQNPRAIRFYEKNGFVRFDKHIFKLGNDEQSDIMMKLELNKEKPVANTV